MSGVMGGASVVDNNFALPLQEFIGIWDNLMKQKVMARAKCDSLVLAFMRFLVDNNLLPNFPDEIDHCLCDMDMAVCRHYNKMRARMKEVTFLNAFAAELSLVMEPDDLSAVLACNGDWSMVPQQLARLYAASHAGELIFWFSIQACGV